MDANLVDQLIERAFRATEPVAQADPLPLSTAPQALFRIRRTDGRGYELIDLELNMRIADLKELRSWAMSRMGEVLDDGRLSDIWNARMKEGEALDRFIQIV